MEVQKRGAEEHWKSIFCRVSSGYRAMPSIKRLLDLQEADWEISSIEKSLAEVRAELADDSSLASARDSHEQLQAQVVKRGLERAPLELMVHQSNEKLQTIEQTLYGGTVTNIRELSAYQQEMEHLQRKQSIDGDKLLELMVEIEELQSVRDNARRHLEQLEAERPVRHSELFKEQTRLESGLTELQKSRDKLTLDIPPSVLSIYESLRKSRGGHAIARVERGMCQSCRITLPTKELQGARNSQAIVQCSSCRRILHAV